MSGTTLLTSSAHKAMYLYSYGILLSYVRRINAYVLRPCDVYMAYEAVRVTYLRRM